MDYDNEQQDTTELAPVKARALEILAGTATMTEAAEQLGIDRATLWRWLHSDDSFRLRLNEQTEQTIARATTRLIENYEAAVTVLEQAIAGEKMEVQQLRAADILLKRLPTLLEMSVVHSRLTQLERQISELG